MKKITILIIFIFLLSSCRFTNEPTITINTENNIDEQTIGVKSDVYIEIKNELLDEKENSLKNIEKKKQDEDKSNDIIVELSENELIEQLIAEETEIKNKYDSLVKNYKEDLNIKLIKQYYEYLNDADYKSAYNLKLTNTSLDNFKESYDFGKYYIPTISVDYFKNIDRDIYKFYVFIAFEGSGYLEEGDDSNKIYGNTRNTELYSTTMQIKDGKLKTLKTYKVENEILDSISDNNVTAYIEWDNSNLNLYIKNQGEKNIIDTLDNGNLSVGYKYNNYKFTNNGKELLYYLYGRHSYQANYFIEPKNHEDKELYIGGYGNLNLILNNDGKEIIIDSVYDDMFDTCGFGDINFSNDGKQVAYKKYCDGVSGDIKTYDINNK